MKKIINITNLNTNEISAIGAGRSISQNNVVIKLAQSTINGIKDNTVFLVEAVRTVPINNIVIPVLSLIGSTIVCRINKGRYARESNKINARLENLLNLQ